MCNASIDEELLKRLSSLLPSAAACWQHTAVLPSEARSGPLAKTLTY